jgi:hypothetical protein
MAQGQRRRRSRRHAVAADGHDRAAAAHRVRERRQPRAGAHAGAATRAGRANRAGRRLGGHHPAWCWPNAMLGLAGGTIAGVAIAYLSLPPAAALGGGRSAVHHDGEDRCHGLAGCAGDVSALATLVFRVPGRCGTCAAAFSFPSRCMAARGGPLGDTRAIAPGICCWSHRWRWRSCCSSARD